MIKSKTDDMDIVIVADFCGLLTEASNNRFLYLADILGRDHDVEMITSDFCHETKQHFSEVPAKASYRITMLHEGSYNKNVSVRRFGAHIGWALRVKQYLETRKKPDVIYCAVPTLLAARFSAGYCKRNGIRFSIDVQDLWPEAFQMVFRVPVLSDVLFAPLTRLAEGVYRSADDVVAVSGTYAKRALRCRAGHKNGVIVYLGTDLNVFDQHRNVPTIDHREEGSFLLGYCGTLGSSYDITCVLRAMDLLRKRGRSGVRFLVMGDGPLRDDFELYARSKNLPVIFTGRLPYGEMCSQLCQCDAAVNPISKGAAQSIINKHADYAASGIPVINTQESRECRRMVEAFQMGVNCRNHSPSEVADAIELLMDDPALRLRMGKNARRCAETLFDRRKSYQKITRLYQEKRESGK